ncbi:MAG: hypothetical protein QF921_00440 [Pseudomonadales bacterium]|jgi:hypothetical protein|nr:hypothetical protein [Pseudomonadales bacterium]MDP6472072.1 hypothetical protein [Pseudomonadales bacterium]MDP6826655.1 hypothetical protein [Pseudomonadales bacterium]MDP6969984.1 hypothetical protein [Pseudomonadales bacterium]|tara:strand:+ start:26 stop:673 length:648 start_codon:yes stop_codon:yes gene_type:complete
MKARVALSAAIVGVAALLMFESERPVPPLLENPEQPTASPLAPTVQPPEVSTGGERQQTITSRPLDPAEGRSIWREVPRNAYPDQLPVLRRDVTGATLVVFDRGRLLDIEANEKFRVSVPQLGRAWDVNVQAVRTSATGSRSIHGHLDADRIYSAVITLGRSGIFGTITTPQGSYSVSGSGDFAWIIAARELRHHVDPSRPDYRVPRVRVIPQSG